MTLSHDKPIPGKTLKLALLIGQMRMGGMEGQLWELYSRLNRSRITPRLISFAPDLDMIPEAKQDEVVIVNKGRGIDLGFYSRLKRELNSFKPDAVLSFLFTANLWGGMAARATHVPVNLAYEGGLEMWLSRPKRMLAGRVHRKATRVIVNSLNSREFYNKLYGLGENHYPLIYNGVDTEIFRPDEELRAKGRADLGLKDEKLIGLIGTFKAAKDHKTFLSAALLLANSHPDSRFLLVGYGELESFIREQIAELGLGERVIIHPPTRELAPLYNACDLCGLSSTEEGFSNVLLEGLACGIPQVATNVGGNPEAIRDGETGILVPPANPAALASAWAKLLDDEELCHAMGGKARADAVTRFSMERMVEETTVLLERLHAENKA